MMEGGSVWGEEKNSSGDIGKEEREEERKQTEGERKEREETDREG